jgi:16S rRNA (guanine1207-N2)-methyltransferase
MHDLASQWLIQQINASTAQRSVWFSDENVLPHLATLAQHAHAPLLMSNRWDIAQQAAAQGVEARFSDFDCSDLADNSQDRIFYRISKEKPVVHHIINQAFRLLKFNGELVICGQKNEGIKTYIDKAKALFDCETAAQKDGTNYSARLQKNALLNNANALDDSDYTQLRIIYSDDTHVLHSKPGLFGWQKIDQGSALLIEQFNALLPNLKPAPENILDLGCGYGYLSLMTHSLPLTRRVLTDNNAAAILAASHNCKTHNITAEVVAADAGSTLEPGFELILCNPPFHQGFSIDGDLTDKFLASAQRLLKHDGCALFVVNQFIPLERKAQKLFRHIELLTQAQGFKVIRLLR